MVQNVEPMGRILKDAASDKGLHKTVTRKRKVAIEYFCIAGEPVHCSHSLTSTILESASLYI